MSSKFNKDFDYLKTYHDDVCSLSAFITVNFQIGDLLILNNKSEITDSNLFELENRLHVLSGAIIYKTSIFGFKWNECFRKTYGLKVKSKNNWFYWADDVNNDEKHLDKNIKNFFIPNFKFDEKEIKLHNQKALPLLMKGRQNITDFKSWIDSDINFRLKEIFTKNKKFNEWMKKHFEISDWKEYVEIKDKFLPKFTPYLTELIYKHKLDKTSFTQVINYLIMMINSKSTISSSVKQHLVIDPWIKFKKGFEEIKYFLFFVYFQLKKHNFNNLNNFTKSEFAKNIQNIWDWYQKERDFFIFWLKKNVGTI